MITPRSIFAITTRSADGSYSKERPLALFEVDFEARNDWPAASAGDAIRNIAEALNIDPDRCVVALVHEGPEVVDASRAERRNAALVAELLEHPVLRQQLAFIRARRRTTAVLVDAA